MIATHTPPKELIGQATTMQAIMQDQYGSADVLKLQTVDKPAIGETVITYEQYIRGQW